MLTCSTRWTTTPGATSYYSGYSIISCGMIAHAIFSLLYQWKIVYDTQECLRRTAQPLEGKVSMAISVVEWPHSWPPAPGHFILLPFPVFRTGTILPMSSRRVFVSSHMQCTSAPLLPRGTGVTTPDKITPSSPSPQTTGAEHQKETDRPNFVCTQIRIPASHIYTRKGIHIGNGIAALRGIAAAAKPLQARRYTHLCRL